MRTEHPSDSPPGARRSLRLPVLAALWLGLATGPLGAARAAPEPALGPEERAALVSRAVRYLASSQRADGTWSDTNGDQPGVLALASLAFLASGEDAVAGLYARNLTRCLDGILGAARADDGFVGESMYNHALVVLALAELYGELPDERIGTALPKAVRLLLRAQSANARGAWRYTPRSLDADTPVTAACLVALAAAHQAGQNLPASAVEQALAFLGTCRNPDGGFGYTGPGESAPPRTAACTLAFALLRGPAAAEARAGCAYLEAQGAGSAQYPFYYRLYAALALAVTDPAAWVRWDLENAAQLRASQGDDGSWGGPQGTVFSTAAAVLSLTAGPQALPIFSR
jgi:hypothetical protein